MVAIPPTTTMARGRWVCEPIWVESAAGNKPKQGRQVGHHRRAHSFGGPLDDRPVQGFSLVRGGVEVGNQQQSIHDGHAEERNKADGRGNAEVGARQVKRPNAAHGSGQNVADDDHGVQPGTQGRIEQEKISPSESGTIHIKRDWASCICSNSPDQTAR